MIIYIITIISFVTIDIIIVFAVVITTTQFSIIVSCFQLLFTNIFLITKEYRIFNKNHKLFKYVLTCKTSYW